MIILYCLFPVGLCLMPYAEHSIQMLTNTKCFPQWDEILLVFIWLVLLTSKLFLNVKLWFCVSLWTLHVVIYVKYSPWSPMPMCLNTCSPDCIALYQSRGNFTMCGPAGRSVRRGASREVYSPGSFLSPLCFRYWQLYKKILFSSCEPWDVVAGNHTWVLY